MYYIKYLDMFEQYYAHLQEAKIVFLQYLVSLQRVTINYQLDAQFLYSLIYVLH
jgi:hypothetical protein